MMTAIRRALVLFRRMQGVFRPSLNALRVLFFRAEDATSDDRHFRVESQIGGTDVVRLLGAGDALETTPPPIFKRRQTMFIRTRYSCSWTYGKWHSGTFTSAPNFILFTDFIDVIVILKTDINIKKNINRQDLISTSTTQASRSQDAQDAYIRRKAVPIIPGLRNVTIPRMVIKSGLPNGPGLRSIHGEVSLGRHECLIYEWDTAGTELPRDSDWRWYAALTSRCASTFAPQRLSLGSLADLHRLGYDLGAHFRGGQMSKRCSLAVARLAQARWGCSVIAKNIATPPAIEAAHIIMLSDGLARALWGTDVPPGVAIEADSDYWIQLSPQHHSIFTKGQFHMPVGVFRRIAKSPSDLSIALWLALTAQSAQKAYPLDQAEVVALVSRMTGRPASRALQDVAAAATALTEALVDEGFPDAFKVDLIRKKPSTSRRPRGRPPVEWTMTIHPAGKPFKSR